MKVFISYSLADVDLLRQVVDVIRSGGDEPYSWDHSRVPGDEAWPSIFKWIDESDMVIVIITDRTVGRAMSVGQEVGRAKAKNKTIIPLVSADVRSGDLGFLSGVIYQQIDRSNPAEALLSVKRAVGGMKLKREEMQRQVLILGGILAAVWLFGK